MATLRIKTGEKKTLNFTLKKKDGTPLDLTGATVTLRAKRVAVEADNAAFLSSTTNSHTNATGGITSLVLDATAITKECRGFFDVAISWPTGDVMKSRTGDFIIEQAITQAV